MKQIGRIGSANIRLIPVPADRDLFGDRLPNGSFTGALGRLVRREVDIVFTGFFIKDYLARDVEFTAGLYSDAVCCLRFTRSGVERLFLTGLLLVSLIFVSLYTSGLAAVFVNPLYYPDIGTLQQLDESGMAIPVKYRGFLDDVFAVNYSRLMDSLRARMQHLPAKESMLARVARLGNIATVTRKTTLALDNAIYLTTRQLHMVPECPRTYNLAYVMPHRSAFGEQFNKVLLRLVGGGLVDHWIEEARYGWTLRDWRVARRMMESSFKVLTVLDMQFAFYVLAIGLAVSVAVIGAELVHFHRAHRGDGHGVNVLLRK
uniref:Uncharacterized protein n=1 Tax=Anopheles coluzzii TaxID=1518534 RepID=A0A8W7PZ76_ANOCL